jgi:transposase
MDEVSIIGVDLAKHVFQLHGARADVGGVSPQAAPRAVAGVPGRAAAARVVAMEACASAHHWGREITGLGHEARLIPPAYVKPFVKRQKNDAADAEAIGLCGVAADHAAQGREVPGAAGPSDAVPDTGPSRAAANAADQRAPGPPRRARGGRPRRGRRT